MSDYDKAKAAGLTHRRGHGHHPMSIRVVEFLIEHDLRDYGDYFQWKLGGDGDNGEMLVSQLDAFFGVLEAERDGR